MTPCPKPAATRPPRAHAGGGGWGGQGGLLDGSINLDMTVSQIPADTRTWLQDVAGEFGLDYSGVTGSTTLRDLLKLLADQMSGLLDPSIFQIAGSGLLLNL